MAAAPGQIGKVRKIAKIGTLTEPTRERAPSFGKITVRPGTPGAKTDPLEAAAVQGVAATLPERIVWKWLDSQRLMYEPQQAELGDRSAHGATVDFEVFDLAALPVVIRVQGSYWHGPAFPGRRAVDDEQAQRLRMEGLIVADLWEQDIYDAVLADRLTPYIMGEIGAA